MTRDSLLDIQQKQFIISAIEYENAMTGTSNRPLARQKMEITG